MKWSLKIGRYAGIDVFVHWTFVLLLGWIFFAGLGPSGDVNAAVHGVVFVLALFACIILHEFGHALTARHYGIRTRDITLLPIGGLARLQRMPENPRQELLVALAGPAVNLVLAGVLFGIVAATGGAVTADITHGSFAARLAAVNLLLALFNLLPAFPMDGGRVLRAILALWMSRRRATQIAANVGQAMAILLGLVGFFLTSNIFLVFIAVFIYLGAQAEAQMVDLVTLIRGLKVRDAMQTRYRALEVTDNLSVAVDELLSGSQHDFPVINGGVVVGMLRRRDLVRGLAERGKEASVGDCMERECLTVDAADSLERAFGRLQEENCPGAPVLEDGALAGVLTMENVSELVMVHSALEGRREPTRI